jgi:putative ABC transport system substrate-binding protein
MRRREFISFIGSAAALPFAISTAKAKVPTLGYLSDEGTGPHPFRSHGYVLPALRKLGYVEGQNIRIEYRNVDAQVDKLPAAAAELAALSVDLIFAVGTPAAKAAVGATKTIPVVFARVGNPETVGLVASSAHPGGNATGVTVFTTELPGKRIQILKDLVPGLSRVAVLHEPKFLPGQLEVKELTALAPSLNVEFYFVGVDSLEALEGAADEIMKGSPQALFVGSSGWFEDNYQLPINAAVKTHLPAMYVRREFVDAGGLVVYGVPYREMYRRAADYVDRVLKGAAPGDLPVENPVRFELVVNRKTARSLGLTLPLSIVTTADEVIE